MKPALKNFSSLGFPLLLFALSCAAFLLLYWQVEKHRSASAQILSEWQAEAERAENLQSIDRLLRNIGQEKAMLDSYFAQSSNVVPFLDAVEKLSSEAKVSAEVTSVEILKDKSGLMVGMKATGTFETVYKFLQLLENSPFELEFFLADFRKEDGQTTNTRPTWGLNLKVKLLSFLE